MSSFVDVLKRQSLARRFATGSEPFILTAMLSLLGGTVWMWRERELMLGHFYRPEFLSITHTITLGWMSMLMMGVLVRLSPRALGLSIRSRRWLAVQFVLMFVGYTGMVFHFWISGWVAMALAAISIVLAAAVQVFNLSGVFRKLRDGDWLPLYIAAAIIHFLLAAIFGVLLGFNKTYDVLGGEFFPNIFAHAHLAALGWVSLLIVGFEHRLLPVSRPNIAARRYGAGLRFWLLEAGILGLVVSLIMVSRWVPLFALMIAAAFWLHAWRPIRMLLAGKIQDRASFWGVIALIFLVVDSAIGVALSLGWPAADSPLRMRVQLAYGYIGFLGWITLTISAMAYKLFPMFVWEERFRSLWGKEPVPAMTDLYSSKLQMLSGCFIALGVAGASTGIVVNYLPVITFFHGVVVLGVAAFLINFFLIARWVLLQKKFRPLPEDWERFRQNFGNRTNSLSILSVSTVESGNRSSSSCDVPPFIPV